MLVGTFVKRLDLCVAAIVGFIARVVCAEMQESANIKTHDSSRLFTECYICRAIPPANRYSDEIARNGFFAKWMSVWMDFIYRQVEFDGYWPTPSLLLKKVED